MKKKLALNETWKYCLQMWKWIVEQRKQNRRSSITALKTKWLEKRPRFREIADECFFCEYAIQHTKSGFTCSQCPGRLVDERFNCSDDAYVWFGKPLKFYQKLVELNEKRKKK